MPVMLPPSLDQEDGGMLIIFDISFKQIGGEMLTIPFIPSPKVMEAIPKYNKYDGGRLAVHSHFWVNMVDGMPSISF